MNGGQFFIYLNKNYFFLLENGNLDPILKQSLLDDRFYNNDSFKVNVILKSQVFESNLIFCMLFFQDCPTSKRATRKRGSHQNSSRL